MANVSNGDSPSLHIVLERVGPSRTGGITARRLRWTATFR